MPLFFGIILPAFLLLNTANPNVGQEERQPADPSIYNNMVIDWQRRILYCAPSRDVRHSGQCYLTIGKNGQPKPANCREETVQLSSGESDSRTLCSIECKGADRDSVISKIPSWNRECVRFFSYDTFQETLPKQSRNIDREWFIWRSGRCRLMEISLEVHCGFP